MSRCNIAVLKQRVPGLSQIDTKISRCWTTEGTRLTSAENPALPCRTLGSASAWPDISLLQQE